ncbi:hypothetical protein V6000_004127 [Aspergillus fumigatus]
MSPLPIPKPRRPPHTLRRQHLGPHLKLPPQRILHRSRGIRTIIAAPPVNIHTPLRKPHQVPRQHHRLLHRLPPRNDPTHQPHVQRLARPDPPPSENQIQSSSQPHNRLQPYRPAVDERDTPPPTEDTEDGILLDDAQVSQQRELQPACDGVAGYRCDKGFG